MGASVNLYMFHGGTNFGFTNGANFSDVYQPTVTSYDYNCPLSESGDLTPKYFAIQKVIQKFWKTHPDEFGPCVEPSVSLKNSQSQTHSHRLEGTVSFTESARLFDESSLLGKPIFDAKPLTMEALGQDFGFVLYQTTLTGPFEKMRLSIDGLHDRALIYLNQTLVGIKERTGKRDDEILIGLDAGQSCTLSILVENMGRINYGPKLLDEKGILHGVRIGPMNHFGWTMHPIFCNHFQSVNWTQLGNNQPQSKTFADSFSQLGCKFGFGPILLRGFVEIDQPGDTFIRPKGFEKGMIAVNGFLLGRYYNSAGPQKTLYLPGPLLKKGTNEIILLELEQMEVPSLLLEKEPDLG